MHKKDILGIMESGISPYTMINSMLVASAHRNANLTVEQKAEREERIRLESEERVRRLREIKILQSICPDCEGKLIRGKKDKKKDYKRVWSCSSCSNSHMV